MKIMPAEMAKLLFTMSPMQFDDWVGREIEKRRLEDARDSEPPPDNHENAD